MTSFGKWTQPGILLGLVCAFTGFYLAPAIWLVFALTLVGLLTRQETVRQVSCGVVLSFVVLLIALGVYGGTQFGA
ncbi:hypothetical protein DW322_00575 [Rhodococcus rhodnii]|uniref:Uncharacterized protein n=2 Tax=Rhodococcus rhodnii TaxID=38312 RepID=R7WR01_9NOCA|nr:hypothetical protein [Rhodococcus rhodnii]EOM77720.1 hypothetical protein Rrhod_0872 [Rhodococcus rhodnii LMG 5362]TXG89004.1 hypothetical protein DW322_00575 [Rhodococcus rhodnii]